MRKRPANYFFYSSWRSLDRPCIKVVPISKQEQDFFKFIMKEAVYKLRVLKQTIDVFFSLQTLTNRGVSIDRSLALLPAEASPYCKWRFFLHPLRNQIIFNPLTKHRQGGKIRRYGMILYETHAITGGVDQFLHVVQGEIYFNEQAH